MPQTLNDGCYLRLLDELVHANSCYRDTLTSVRSTSHVQLIEDALNLCAAPSIRR